jgi:virulence factor
MKTVDPPCTIALIGCGHIARTIYVPVIQSLKDRVRVTAVCDLRPGAARDMAALFSGARAYADAGTLFREEKPDAAMVLTKETANAPTAGLALKAGVPVYLEKPPAVSVAQWEELMRVEASTGVPLFTAFNRRHTPLFRGWEAPEGLRNVRGLMERQGRPAATFPYTAAHLIDSAQFFSGSCLDEASASLEEELGIARWEIRGEFANGAFCELTVIPSGPEHRESLVFETERGTWDFQFPNPEGTSCPQGRLEGLEEGSSKEGREDDPLEAMGYAPCFRDFLDYLERGNWSECPHRLASCGGTVRLLEEMMAEADLLPVAGS